MLKIPSMGCDGREWTNGKVNLQGQEAKNLLETSPVTLASLHSPRDE